MSCWSDTLHMREIDVPSLPPSLPQAKEKAAQQHQAMAEEQDNNLTELCNHVHGDMLTENPAVAQSAFGSHRY